MAQKTNNELLGEILGTLDSIIRDNSRRKQAQTVNVEVKGENDMVAILSGVLASKDGAKLDDVSRQVGELAKGLRSVESLNHKALTASVKAVASMFSALSSINMSTATAATITAMGTMLQSMSTLNTKALQEFAALDAGLMADNARTVIQSLKTLATGIDKQTLEQLKPLQDFVSKFNALVQSSINTAAANMNPLKAKLVGMSINNFYMSVAEQFVVLSKKIAEMLKEVKLNKDSSIGFQAIMGALSDMDTKKFEQFHKMASRLDPDDAVKFVDFVRPILQMVNELQNKGRRGQEFAATLGALSAFIGSISVGRMLGMKLASKVMNGETGAAFAAFFGKIGEIVEKFDKDRIERFGDIVSEVTKGVGIVLLSVLGAALAIKAFGVGALVGGIAALVTVSLALVGLVKILSHADKDISAGTKAMRELGVAAGLMVMTIGAVMLIDKIGGDGAMFKAMGTVITIMSTLALFVAGMVLMDRMAGAAFSVLGGKGEGGMFRQGASVMRDLGAGVMMAVAAIGVVMLIQKFGDEKSIWSATNVVLGVTVALALVLAGLSLLLPEKKVEAATGALLGIGATVMLMTLAIGAMTYIVKKYDTADILTSLGIVAAVTVSMVGVLWALSKVSKGQLVAGSVTLIVLTACVWAVSKIIEDHFIPLAEDWESAMIGGGLVMATIGLMLGGVWALSKIEKEKLL